MNTHTLPRTPVAIRLQSLLAATTVTLALLSEIQQLAVSEAAPAMMAQATQASA